MLRRSFVSSPVAAAYAARRSFTAAASPRIFSSSRFQSGSAPSASNTQGVLDFFHEYAGGNPVVSLGAGMTLLAGGIVLINLSERRHAKQEQLDDSVEPLVVSLTDDADVLSSDGKQQPKVHFESDKALDSLIFHASGPVVPKEPYARDEDLGVHAPGQLRLKRNVEMYQFEEHEEKHKDKEGREWCEFTYTKKWSSSALECKGDKRNPRFPLFVPVQEASELDMIVKSRPRPQTKRGEDYDRDDNNKTVAAAAAAPKDVQLLLSYNFVERLQNFVPASIFDSKTNKNGVLESYPDAHFDRAKKHFDLCPSKDSNKLITCGADEADAAVGDVRVTYEIVPAGEYSALGLYNYRADRPEDEGMVAIRGNVRESLARSFGELIVPDETNAVARQAAKHGAAAAGVQSQEMLDFTKNLRIEIPEPLVDFLEMALLTIQPIEFGFIEKGNWTKNQAFQHQRQDQGKTTGSWFSAGLSACGIGTSLVAATVSSSPIILGSALSTGIGIAYSTRKGARHQIRQKIERGGGLGKAKRNESGGFDL